MAIRFYVAHGASGSAASMAGHVRGLVARGVDARAIDLPVKKAEAAVPVFRAIVPDGPEAAGADSMAIAVGGQSYGGRVASLAAAMPDTDYAALVLFSYPLHPPGRPTQADDRSSHWPSVRCPVLLLSGESDPFAQIELLRARVELLKHAELITYPNLGHTLKPVLNDALDRTAEFLLSPVEKRGVGVARSSCRAPAGEPEAMPGVGLRRPALVDCGCNRHKAAPKESGSRQTAT